jgi:hypothetical protein
MQGQNTKQQADPIDQFAQQDGEPGTLSIGEMDNDGPNTTGEDSIVLSHRVDRARQLRADRNVRIVVPAFESFTTDGTADNTETFNLSHNIIDSPAGENLVLWEAGNRVQPDSINYSGDSFDYTDDGTGNNLYAWYIPQDAASVSIVKRAPKGQSGTVLQEEVFDAPTSLLHTRNQVKNGLNLDLGGSRGKPIVPEDWDLRLVVNAPYTVRYDDPNGDGATADNFVVSVPWFRQQGRVEGLDQAVRFDIAGQ